jgi:epoxyqueuosine reductase
MNLTERIKAQAQKLGFELVGVIPATSSQMITLYEEWISKGYAGEMEYLKRHAPLKREPRQLLPEAKSIVALAMNYYTVDTPSMCANDPSRGQISRYAWGKDYHDVIRAKLNRLAAFIKEISQKEVKTRVYVDSAPVLEREYAERAGIGWIGKNTNIINWQSGSWFFLAGVLVSIELEESPLPLRGSCGSCTRCIDACPTDAILAPNVLDARRCISYLTIELKGGIPRELRPQMGNLIFGCDICQEVCPWNSKATPTDEPDFYPRRENFAPRLLSLIHMTRDEFNKRFKDSPIKRAKRRGFLRNVAVALGNWGHPSAVPALKKALNDEESLVRGHAAWALGQIGGKSARKALEDRLRMETDAEALAEIQAALRDE